MLLGITYTCKALVRVPPQELWISLKRIASLKSDWLLKIQSNARFARPSPHALGRADPHCGQQRGEGLAARLRRAPATLDVATNYNLASFVLRRTRASIRNIGKINFLPSEVVKEENHSTFHVHSCLTFFQQTCRLLFHREAGIVPCRWVVTWWYLF